MTSLNTFVFPSYVRRDKGRSEHATSNYANYANNCLPSTRRDSYFNLRFILVNKWENIIFLLFSLNFKYYFIYLQHRLLALMGESGGLIIWERRFRARTASSLARARASVVVHQESRKFKKPQQTDDNEASAWYVSIYHNLYSPYWRGLTALSILCGLGNARAFDARMGKKQTPTPFLYLKPYY